MKKLLDLIKLYKKQVLIGAVILFTIILLLVVVLAMKNTNNNNKENNSNTNSNSTTSISESELPSETIPIVESIDDPQPQQLGQETGIEVNASAISDNEYLVSGKTYGIDVSKWQGAINWEKVKSSGIEFAMIRVGYRTEGSGTIVEDPYAKYNLQNATAAGIKVGVYFFSTAVSTAEAEEEALWTTNLISKYKITYPVAYNCEGFTQLESRMYSLSKTERTNNAIAFLNTIKNQGYSTPMFYGNISELKNSSLWNTDEITSKFSIWIAGYPGTTFTENSTSSYTGTHSMWQYTNKGVVDGINGFVDMDVAYFGYTTTAPAKDTSGASEVSLPTQSTTVYNPYTANNDTVTAKIETNLRTVASSADNSTIVYLLKNGETVQRTAIGTNGWSKVTYAGQTLYAKSSNLMIYVEPTTVQTTTTQTTTAPAIGSSVYDSVAGMSFYTTNDQVTAKDKTNLRTAPNFADTTSVVYTLLLGEYITRTGRTVNSDSEGWSRVIYDGKILYALSSYLKN